MNTINAVCVYAASSGQVADVYKKAAQRLGSLLASEQISLVNGAGRTGLMGATADACLEAGGRAVGVIPHFMVSHGWGHDGLSEVIVTADMHSRKQKMAELADGCIALPGGCGTLEELLEIITWKQLGIYLKPIIVLNVNGFFDPLLTMLAKAIDEQFMRPMHKQLWCVAQTAEEAIMLLRETPLWNSENGKFAAL